MCETPHRLQSKLHLAMVASNGLEIELTCVAHVTDTDVLGARPVGCAHTRLTVITAVRRETITGRVTVARPSVLTWVVQLQIKIKPLVFFKLVP